MSTEDLSTSPSSLLSAQVSVFDGVKRTAAVEQLTLGAMLTRIQDDTYKAPIEALRALRAQDAAKYKEQKTFLPAFTPGCALHTRAKKVAWKDKLIAPSQIIHLDVDHIEAAALKARVIMEPSVVFAFISPSGAGVKLGIASEGITDADSYKQIWRTTIAAWKARFPDATFKEDEQVKYLNALCFVSHDPDLYQNDAAVPFLLPPSSSSSPSAKEGRREGGRSLQGGRRGGGEEQARVEDALSYIPPGVLDEYGPWLNMGMALHDSGEPWARGVWDTWSARGEKYDAAVQDVKWASFQAGGGITIATLFHLAKEHGYRSTSATLHVGDTAVPHEADGESPQHAADALLAHLPTLAEEARLGFVLAQVELLAALDMPAWILLKPQLKHLVPGVKLGDLDRARNEKRRATRVVQGSSSAATSASSPTVPLLLTKDGRPRGVLGNVLAVLTHDPRWQGVLGYNALNDEATFLKCPPCYPDEAATWTPRPLEDRDDAEIANWMQWLYQICTATSTVHDSVQACAHRKTYHPIRDYLHSLKWDTQSRLDRWLVTYCHAEDTPYARAIGKDTLIGAVARVEHPGCKMDTATFLVGEQGTRKSTTWRVLCGDAWFSDTLPDLHDKDAMQALRGKWIIELGELATFHRNEVEIVKRYLSATQDHYRPSYGRRARTFLRQNIFVGTTNREDIFKDETGNRRFYPITTKGMCDTDALERDRDQLWAEALYRYHQGEAWHLDPAMAAIAATVQAEHMEHDPWEESVLEYVKDFVGKTKVTTKDVMRYCFLWDNPALWTPAASKRIGAILRRNGWRPTKRWDYEATPKQAASEPDPKKHHDRVAAFWKHEEPRMK